MWVHSTQGGHSDGKLSIEQQQPEVTVYKALQPSLPEGSASHTWAGHPGDTIVYFKTFYFGCLRLALDDVGGPRV